MFDAKISCLLRYTTKLKAVWNFHTAFLLSFRVRLLRTDSFLNWHAERDFSGATRLSRHKWLTHVGKNSMLYCFLPLALPPCSNPFLHIKIIRNPQMQIPYYWHAERDFSSATRLSRHKWLTHVGKNSPPDCFLPQIFRFAPSLFESLSIQKNNTKPTKADFALLAR